MDVSARVRVVSVFGKYRAYDDAKGNIVEEPFRGIYRVQLDDGRRLLIEGGALKLR